MGLFYPLVAVLLWAGGAGACSGHIWMDFLGSSLGNVHPADRAGVISRLNDCLQYAVRRNPKISYAKFIAHTDRCGNFYPKIRIAGNKKMTSADPHGDVRRFVASLGILVRGVRWRAEQDGVPDPACTRRPLKPRLRPFPARLCNDGGASARRLAAARRRAAAAAAARRRRILAARRASAARKLAAARRRAAIRARLYRQCGCGR